MEISNKRTLMKLQFFLALFLMLITFCCSLHKVIRTDEVLIQEKKDDGVMRNISSVQLVANMKPGWNMGNSLDAEGKSETAWKNPIITKTMIDEVKNKGFGTIRIPVTWRFHTGKAPSYTIEESWLERVQQVVDYAKSNDMYVIINIHHDDSWIIPTYDKSHQVKDRLNKVWTQIANHFKNYSDYLIFELLNEPRYKGTPEEWTGGTVEGRDVVNQYNKTCLDAIRATGGNNTRRHIMISAYAADQGAMDDFMIPNDNRLIVSVHNYFPYEFSLGSDFEWGTDTDKAQMDAAFNYLKNKFIDNGLPVIMGEWSSINNNNKTDRIAHADYYARGCVSRGILPIWWDNGNFNGSAIFNRKTLTWYFPEIADTIINSKP